MIIGIDGNEANVGKRVGTSWTTYYLLQEFYERKSADLKFRIFLKSPPLTNLPKESQNWEYRVIAKKTFWSQVDLPLALYLKNRDLDIFFSPAHYSPRFCPCPVVVMVHDLSYFYYPQNFLKRDLYQLINWTGYSVKKARRVIAVSETTKKDLLSCYHLPEKKITVIPNGFKKPDIKPEMPSWQLKQPYFLYLGTLQPRKNLETLILAFEKILAKYPQTFLYLAGKKGWLFDDLETVISRHRLKEHVFLTGYLAEAQKWYLLKKAEALVMPGWYEGFGLPVLEAFSVETPVICSRAGALPEIAGKAAALYFTPDSVDELTKAMLQILSQPEKTQALKQAGKEQLRNFSWKKTAAEILNLFQTKPGLI